MGPLQGCRVLEIDLMAPARFTGYVLASLGAEVINIEAPRTGRKEKSLRFRDDDDSRWLWYQQNKKSVVLNLRTPDGLELFYRMAETADAIVEGFRPGAAERLHVDYESIKQRNPRIVYCSATAFGQDGPYKDLFGRETAYGAVTGLTDLCSPPEGAPMMLPFLVTDTVGGLNAAVAVLAALSYRERTGKGQYIDACTYDSMFPFLGLRVHDQWLGSWFGSRPRRVVSGLETLDLMETKDGRYVVITPDGGEAWDRFCRAIAREDLIPLREALGSQDADKQADAACIQAALKEVFISKTMREWEEINMRENVGIVPVLNLGEALNSEHARARQMVIDVDYAPLGRTKTIGVPFKFSETPGQVRGYPRYGEHTEEVLNEFGCGERWDELRAKRVVE